MKAFESTTEKEKNGLSLQHEQKSAPAIQCKGYEARTSYPLPPVQRKHNRTGLPDNLKAGVENLSGFSMDDVQVHYNSDKPARLEALAYAQGTDIHVAPGQEQHLPHEAWHVVQQKQGRVKPTMQLNAKIGVNDDKGLEQEADKMGQSATQIKHGNARKTTAHSPNISAINTAPVQLFKIKRPRFLSTKPKYNTTSLATKSKITASDTYDVTTDKTMGSSGTKTGVGKRGIEKTIDYPESAYNLGMTSENNPNPRMLARQVAMSRLAKKLSLPVISNEKFVSHTNTDTDEKELIAVSTMVNGKSLHTLHNEGNIRQGDLTPSLQKQFSDLQVLDALAGQTDRHGGNIFVDYANQQVKGIDNDQAFPANNYFSNVGNSRPSFAVGNNRLDSRIEYKQSQIDKKTAAKILKLKSKDLPNILNSVKGKKEGEIINKEEIDAMKLRLKSMKIHIKNLKKDKKIIKTWDDSTLSDALNEADRGLNIDDPNFGKKEANYIKKYY